MRRASRSVRAASNVAMRERDVAATRHERNLAHAMGGRCCRPHHGMIGRRPVSSPAETLDAAADRLSVPAVPPRRNHVGTVSLVCAVVGMVVCRVALGVMDEPWLRILAAGFEAATVGGLADW